MNNLTRFIHRSVIKSNLEEFFVALRKRINVIRKFIPLSIRHKFGSVGRFIPQSESYSKNDNYLLTRDYTRFRINRSDYVQWRIFYGVRDNSLIQAKKLVRPNSVVLDIGANFGAFSLRLASHISRKNMNGTRVHAFEPNTTVVTNLASNLALNPELSDIVTIHPFGLGNAKAKLPFQFGSVNSGAGRIVADKKDRTIHIEVERLDDIVDAMDPNDISFIKMIVEGFEPLVFKGAVKTIERYKPPIFFEVTPQWYAENGSSLSDILGNLKHLGYSFYGELHNELIPYDPAVFAGS
jgi:FkbM family methyltransferase